MTANPCYGAAVHRVRKHLPKAPTVLELGSQTLTFQVKGHDLKTVQDFYKVLGFSGYSSIDTDGKGTINADLNHVHRAVLGHKGDGVHSFVTYDLVTNNGTGEHIFNQAAVFETMHNLCKVGGVMLHILPWINWRNHGFYNFNPILFYDLALENGYELLECSRADRNGQGLETVGFEEIKKPDPTETNWFVIAALKKTTDAPFKVPTQSKYRAKPVQKAVQPTRYDLFSGLERIDAPFPVYVGKGPEGLYRQLEAAWPKDPYSGVEGANKLWQINGPSLANHVGGVWTDFAVRHTRRAFLQEALKLFGPDIPADARKLPLECGVRGMDRLNPRPFELDVQAAINTPVTKKSSVRGPHVDDPKELIAGLWYFPVEGDDAGGDLQIYRWKKNRKFVGRPGMRKKAEADPKSVELVATIPYEPNTMVFFLNSADAVHGVSPRKPTKNLRRYVNFLVELREPLFELK